MGASNTWNPQGLSRPVKEFFLGVHWEREIRNIIGWTAVMLIVE
jgi:hypothetical protein